MWRPIWLPIDRTALVINASIGVWRLLARRLSWCWWPLRRLVPGELLVGAPLQHLKGGFAVDRLIVAAGERAGGNRAAALIGRERSHARAGRPDQRLLHDPWDALGVQGRHQRRADPELGDHLLGLEPGIGAKSLCRRAHRLLVTRREGAERVLNAVAELPEDLVGDVERVLRDEVDANTFGAD